MYYKKLDLLNYMDYLKGKNFKQVKNIETYLKVENEFCLWMRTITHIPHPQMKISVFQYNDKYIIEMEAAQYKQTYKISVDSVNGLEGIKALCTDELIQNTLSRFSAMHTDFAKAYKQIS